MVRCWRKGDFGIWRERAAAAAAKAFSPELGEPARARKTVAEVDVVVADIEACAILHLQPRTSPQQQGLSSASTIEKISRVKRRMYIQRTPLPRIRRQRPRRPAPLHHILQSVRQCRSNGHIPRCTLDAPYQPLPTRRSERYSRFPLELAGASNVRSSCALSAGVQLHFECSFRVLRSSRQLVHWDTGRPFFLTSKSGRSVC